MNLMPGHDTGFTPPDIIHDSAIDLIVQFIQNQGSSRGPYKLERDGANQQLPGTTLPSIFVQALSMMSNHPALGYGGDRPALIRNFLFQALMANVVVLSEEDPDHTTVKFAKHIVNAELNLRSELQVEEMNMSFVEDLAFVSGSLELRLATKNKEAVFQLLEKIFHFVRSIDDKTFWQPSMLRLMNNVPEIDEAMEFLRNDLRYANDKDFQSWEYMLSSIGED